MRSPLREALIDVDAISGNVARLKELAGTEHFLAVVKANGYGHGAVPAARAALAGGANWLGTADIVEALELREAGIEAPLLAWLHAPDEDFREAAEANLDVGVSSLEELDRAAAAGVAHVQLKVDTGLTRNGAPEYTWERLAARAAEHEAAGRTRVRGLFSHFANAGDEADALQCAAFDRAIDVVRAAGLEPELLHLSASAATLRRPEARYSMVRVGIAVYGLSPFTDVPSAALGLVPALELRTRVVSVKRVPAGTGVSYDHTYRPERETRLALLPIGYADGVPRGASNRGRVWINGALVPVAGTIAMDQLVVDVGETSVEVGDTAILWGDPVRGVPSLADWAEAAGTINYELATRLGRRVQRTWLGA